MRMQALCLVVLGVCAMTANAHQSSPVVAQKLETLRARGLKEGWTFTVGDTDLLEASLQSITGFKRAPNWEKLAPWVLPKMSRDLPARLDWREMGVVTSIKNQHLPVYCGSCWAFGTDAALESVIAIATGKMLDLAEQQLVSCQPSYGTCEGGDFAFGFYKSAGANYNADFPYVATDSRCNTSAPQHEKVTSWGYVGSESRSPSTDQIKQAIQQYGPIAVTVAASDAFEAYKGGVYNACDSQETNHIVSLIGWDDADGVWLMKNSWGTEWGEQGFMRIKYAGSDGQKCNAVADSAAFVVYKPALHSAPFYGPW